MVSGVWTSTELSWSHHLSCRTLMLFSSTSRCVISGPDPVQLFILESLGWVFSILQWSLVLILGNCCGQLSNSLVTEHWCCVSKLVGLILIWWPCHDEHISECSMEKVLFTLLFSVCFQLAIDQTRAVKLFSSAVPQILKSLSIFMLHWSWKKKKRKKKPSV